MTILKGKPGRKKKDKEDNAEDSDLNDSTSSDSASEPSDPVANEKEGECEKITFPETNPIERHYERFVIKEFCDSKKTGERQ